MQRNKQYVTLNNGVKIPNIGYGTWQIFNGHDAVDIFKEAVVQGYRHFDTATLYENEKSLGKALNESSVHREDFFITSKVLSKTKTYEGTIEAFNQSLKALDIDYLDLYLIHGPSPIHDRNGNYDKENIEVWKALETLYNEGRVRAIGVSNFNVKALKNIMHHAKIRPMVNQIRYFAGYTQDEIVAFCQSNDILIEGYSPLGVGKLLKNEWLKDIAFNHQVSAAQVAIKFCLQNNVLPLPKTQTPSRMKENLMLDFTLSSEDMHTLKSIDDPLR